MDREERVYGLQLDHYALGDNKVDPAVDLDAAVPDRHGNLSVKGKASYRQLVSVSAFQENWRRGLAWAELTRPP